MKSVISCVPPGALVVIYFLVLCCTCQSIAAVDPLQEMLLRCGAFGHLDDLAERINAVKSCVGLGLSCSVLAGLIVGIVLDYIGPKITAILGQVLQLSGFLLMFFVLKSWSVSVGAICLGFAFQAILNSHMSISVFYPDNVALILAVLGAAPDVSLFLPAQMKSIAFRLGGESSVQKVIASYLIFVVGTCLALDALFVPFQPFAGVEAKKDSMESKAVRPDSKETYGSIGRNDGEDAPTGTGSVIQSAYLTLPLRDQLKTIHFWVFVPFFVANFARRKHFASNVRGIFSQISGSSEVGSVWADSFNSLVPFGFLPAILWGIVTDKYGVIVSALFCNVAGLGISLIPLASWMPLQILTIACYMLNSSYIFGLLFAYCATTYGFLTLATLQGIASTTAGLFAMGMDLGWNSFIAHTLGGSFFYANIIVSCLGFLMFLTPLYTVLRPPPTKVVRGVAPERRTMGFNMKTFSIGGQYYDRGSLKALGNSSLQQRPFTVAKAYDVQFLTNAP